MQLDLFAQSKKPAKLYAFPVDRRVSLVRATVHELCGLDYIAGRKFWSAHVKALRGELRAAGLTVREVDVQIRKYSETVAIAINARTGVHQGGPDTAA